MLELLNQKYPIENFYHPALLTLLEYDEQYNTNYVEFLIIYLACGNNNNLCAKCFDIHYNSVKYRLNVIQEISNIDIKNIKELMNLYITCQIYVEKHPHILEKYKDFLKELPQTLF
jgi:DNA-binding PucR family transcriptional regulator